MLRYRTLYLPWFVFYLEWKSVRLELLTSIFCTKTNNKVPRAVVVLIDDFI